jgi:hypothetical protein
MMNKGDGQEAQTLDEENQPGPKEIEGDDENEPQPQDLQYKSCADLLSVIGPNVILILRMFLRFPSFVKFFFIVLH